MARLFIASLHPYCFTQWLCSANRISSSQRQRPHISTPTIIISITAITTSASTIVYFLCLFHNHTAITTHLCKYRHILTTIATAHVLFFVLFFVISPDVVLGIVHLGPIRDCVQRHRRSCLSSVYSVVYTGHLPCGQLQLERRHALRHVQRTVWQWIL